LDYKKGVKYYLFDIAVIKKDFNYVLKKYPELEKVEHEGLVKISKNAKLNKDGFSYKDDYLIFNEQIRQSFSFLRRLIQLRKENSNLFDLAFKINYDVLGVKGTEREMFLKSFWDGMPGFNVEYLNNRKEAISIYGPDNSDLEFQDKTEFYIKKSKLKNGGECWQLEIEEHIPLRVWGLMDENFIWLDNKERKYFTRYLHAYLSLDFELCYHIDWAYKDYSNFENYKQRNNEKIDNSLLSRTVEKIKLLRLDSEKGIDFWSEIINAFFYMNPYPSDFFNNTPYPELEKQRNYYVENQFKKLIKNQI
ncbi:MAG: hypothetical protein PF569_00285, partial [Candidatus Woesearchaeota archaeon]|nr:hypothetical protein [Candidatus Woesearchaeota archaeon]